MASRMPSLTGPGGRPSDSGFCMRPARPCACARIGGWGVRACQPRARRKAFEAARSGLSRTPPTRRVRARTCMALNCVKRFNAATGSPFSSSGHMDPSFRHSKSPLVTFFVTVAPVASPRARRGTDTSSLNMIELFSSYFPCAHETEGASERAEEPRKAWRVSTCGAEPNAQPRARPESRSRAHASGSDMASLPAPAIASAGSSLSRRRRRERLI